jgi:hypothetical protein
LGPTINHGDARGRFEHFSTLSIVLTVRLGSDGMIPNCGNPTTVRVTKHPIRDRIVGPEQRTIQKKGRARYTKVLQTLDRCFNIDTGRIGQIYDHVVFQRTNQRGSISHEELQGCFSTATSDKDLPMSLKE